MGERRGVVLERDEAVLYARVVRGREWGAERERREHGEHGESGERGTVTREGAQRGAPRGGPEPPRPVALRRVWLHDGHVEMPNVDRHWTRTRGSIHACNRSVRMPPSTTRTAPIIVAPMTT